MKQVSKMPIYIFDLDGTLALIDHRRHFVEAPMINNPNHNTGVVPSKIKDPSFKPDWDSFWAACVKDAPNWPVIGTLLQLYACGCEVRIWSGRLDKVREETLHWLSVYLNMDDDVLDEMLLMRPGGDFRPDEELKKKWLNMLTPYERSRLVAVFDDRQKVVDMWRANGVACFQVAPGDF